MKHFFFLLSITFCTVLLIQTPAQQIGEYNTSNVVLLDSNITLVGRITAQTFFGPFYVVGNNLYLSQGNTLNAYDISNPASPAFLGGIDLQCCIADVFAACNYVYVTGSQNKLVILDVSDPINPVETGSIGFNDIVDRLVVSGNYAYVSNESDGMRVIDISNPSSPVEVGFYITPGVAGEVDILGNNIFVADGHSGLRIIDVSNPSNPTEVGFYDTPGLTLGVYTYDKYAYVGDGQGGMPVIDVSDPANPVEVGLLDIGNNVVGVARLSGFENYVYVPMANIINIVDVSDSSSPVIVGSFATESGPNGHIDDIHGNGEYIYASDRNAGFYILQNDFVVGVNDEKNPTPASFKLFQNYPNPFNPSTKIKFTIPNVGTSLMKFVQLNVYDVLGNEVATLVNEYKPAGEYEVEFNAENLPSGIYFYQLRAGSFIQTKKMILIK
ncbi:LVIVD repeat protein [bacterium BMS3Abin03]|nr:LVIVD repeat protein [bacterium BMS3Abin03]